MPLAAAAAKGLAGDVLELLLLDVFEAGAAAQGLGNACVFNEFSGTLSTFNSLAKRSLASSEEPVPLFPMADSIGP